jgi:hypothetical protein
MYVNFTLVGLLGAAALRWGAGPEKVCAAALVFVTLVDPIYHILVRYPVFETVDIGHLVMDAGVAAAFIAVALRANRVYPLWLAAFQLVSLLSHFARELTEVLPMLAYGLMSYGPYYIILLILAGGIFAHARRMKILGPYRSWRNSSPRSRAPAPRSQPTG